MDNYDAMRSNYQDIIKDLTAELESYKIALKYFTNQSQANRDIAANLLKELEG